MSQGFGPAGYPTRPPVSYQIKPTTVWVDPSSTGVTRRRGALRSPGQISPITLKSSASKTPREKSGYESIKECCGAHNSRKLKTTDEWQERWIFSRLFPRFSYWSEHAERGRPKLVDIEVSFRRGWEKPKIDLLFLEAEGRLRFVEVKRQYDPRVRSRGSKPEVLEQIRRYEDVLKNGQDRIVCVYRDVSKVLDGALEVERFSQPMEVFPLVPVLVCRKDARDGQDRWLREQLQSCRHDVIGRHLIVDGGSIDGGLYEDIGHPSWCPDGRWERLNLREVFQKVDESRTQSAATRVATPHAI